MVVAIGAALLGAIPALAADPGSRVISAKRQLALCMTKRMSDSKTLSYNEASKLCKEQLQVHQSTLTSSVLAKPMTASAPQSMP